MREETPNTPKKLASLFTKVKFYRLHHQTTNNFEIHEYDLTPIKLDVGYFTPFFFPRKNLVADLIVSKETLFELLGEAKKFVSKHNRKFGVLAINSRVVHTDDVLREFSDAKIVLLTREKWEELSRYPDPSHVYDKLGLLLTRYLGREFLSPYLPGRPAIGGRFFARNSTSYRIRSSRNNIIVIGSRRIGKTSLLREVAGGLRREQNFQIVEVYAGKCRTLEDVLYEIYVELDSKDMARELDQARSIYLSTNAVNDFRRHIMKAMERDGRPIAIMIDEYDHVLDFDQKKNHILSHIFREMASIDDTCRFFFAGFRKMKKAIESINHPLYNFGQVTYLEPFSRAETFEMISVPLTRMDIELGEDLKETIYNHAGGLPELIQVYCANIVKFYEAKNVLPSSEELLREVANSDDFKHKIQASFLVNANPLEQLICFLVIRDADRSGAIGRVSFTLSDLRKLLKSTNYDLSLYALHSCLENLQMTAIIKRSGAKDGYEFLIPHLVDFLLSVDLEYEIKRILDEVGVNSPAYQTLPAEREPANVVNPANETRQNVLYWLKERDKVLVTHPAPVILRGDLPDSLIKYYNRDFQKINNINRSSASVNIAEKARMFYLELTRVVENIDKLLDLDEKEPLRIESAPKDLNIPFELIPSGKGYLATKIALSRRLVQENFKNEFLPPFHHELERLRINGESFRALIVANDHGGKLPAVPEEAGMIGKILTGGKVEAEISLNEPIEKIEERLRDKRFHCLHFCGHTQYIEGQHDQSGLSIPSEKDRTDTILYGRFAQALGNRNLLMVYLSCCHGAASDMPEIGQTYLNCIEALVNAGIPNIVGFRWAIEDTWATRFAEEFYREIFGPNQNTNLGRAMLETRKKLWNHPRYRDAAATSVLVSQTT